MFFVFLMNNICIRYTHINMYIGDVYTWVFNPFFVLHFIYILFYVLNYTTKSLLKTSDGYGNVVYTYSWGFLLRHVYTHTYPHTHTHTGCNFCDCAKKFFVLSQVIFSFAFFFHYYLNIDKQATFILILMMLMIIRMVYRWDECEAEKRED